MLQILLFKNAFPYIFSCWFTSQAHFLKWQKQLIEVSGNNWVFRCSICSFLWSLVSLIGVFCSSRELQNQLNEILYRSHGLGHHSRCFLEAMVCWSSAPPDWDSLCRGSSQSDTRPLSSEACAIAGYFCSQCPSTTAHGGVGLGLSGKWEVGHFFISFNLHFWPGWALQYNAEENCDSLEAGVGVGVVWKPFLFVFP